MRLQAGARAARARAPAHPRLRPLPGSRAAAAQVRHSPYRGLLHCARETWREEGLRAFYKSYWTTVGGRHL